MPKPDIYLSVIVPAYNEAEKLPKTLRRFQEYFLAQAYSYEILVVNDGSRDRTPEIINEMTGEIKNLRFIDRKKKYGQGLYCQGGDAYGLRPSPPFCRCGQRHGYFPF